MDKQIIQALREKPQAEIKPSPRNGAIGFLADALRGAQSGMNKIELPIVGGLGDLVLGGAPQLADDISYYGPSAMVRGGNAVTGGIVQYSVKPEVLDLAGVATGLGGLARNVAKTAARGLVKNMGARNMSGMPQARGQVGSIGSKSTKITPELLRGEISSPPSGVRFGSDYYSSTKDQDLYNLARALDEGMDLRSAIREAEPESQEVFDFIRKVEPPEIDMSVDKNALHMDYKLIKKSNEEFSDLHENFGNFVYIDLIKANKDIKGKGMARSALVKKLQEIEKKYPNNEIVLNALPLDDSLTQSELFQFYKSLGFEPTDFQGHESVNMKFEGFPDYIKKQLTEN